MKRLNPYLLLVSLLMAAVGCSHRTELRQEIAAANELLPTPYSIGLTARSIALEGDEVVYRIDADEAVAGCAGCEASECRQRIETQLRKVWSDDKNAQFRQRIDRAGCSVRYVIRFVGSGQELEIATSSGSEDSRRLKHDDASRL